MFSFMARFLRSPAEYFTEDYQCENTKSLLFARENILEHDMPSSLYTCGPFPPAYRLVVGCEGLLYGSPTPIDVRKT